MRTVSYDVFTLLLLLLIFLANTEANERRIRNVENCFGASGQVSVYKFTYENLIILCFKYL